MPVGYRFLRLHIDDNVAVALDPMPGGYQIDSRLRLENMFMFTISRSRPPTNAAAPSFDRCLHVPMICH